ncbi:replication initiation protein RepC [uncultured Sulfitobacter sp.]|uniref:replication initiation protein RepC n=1 Tax=uncultured Sulfitobacter sp. TaxID=191468 RepID=UPI00261A428F|nr:replication initiation protein RepC [uncultured Sulfitobacter sp.]
MTTTTHPVLPQGFKRFSVEQTLLDAASLIGLRGSTLHALLHMMKRTRPDDWTDPTREPVYFGQQDATARALGKTRRALYSTEIQLERMGLIERRVKANGQRSPHGGCGIVFSKLIEAFPDLLNMIEQAQIERKRIKALTNERSSCLRYIKARLREAPAGGSALDHIADQLATWPRADTLARMGIDSLEAHVEDARRLCIAVDDIHDLQRDSSGQPAQNFPRHIQENNLIDLSVICNGTVDKSSAALAAHSDIPAPEPIGPGDCGEKKCEAETEARKAKMLDRLTPDRLFKMASPDMQHAISEQLGGRTEPRRSDFFRAAEAMLPALGINVTAWNDAVAVMGIDRAWLTLLYIDAKRDHPATPTGNPGGLLRDLTRKDRQGRFQLDGGLIGVLTWKGV